MATANKNTKSNSKSGRTSTRAKVTRVFHQARESLKLLETLEKETLAKAKTFVSGDSKRLTNEKILSRLQSLGVATRAEVTELKSEIIELRQELDALRAQLTASGIAPTPTTKRAGTEAFPT